MKNGIDGRCIGFQQIIAFLFMGTFAPRKHYRFEVLLKKQAVKMLPGRIVAGRFAVAFFFGQFFGKLAFAIAVQLRPCFIDAQVIGNIFFVQLVIQYPHPGAECLNQKKKQ